MKRKASSNELREAIKKKFKAYHPQEFRYDFHSIAQHYQSIVQKIAEFLETPVLSKLNRTFRGMKLPVNITLQKDPGYFKNAFKRITGDQKKWQRYLEKNKLSKTLNATIIPKKQDGISEGEIVKSLENVKNLNIHRVKIGYDYISEDVENLSLTQIVIISKGKTKPEFTQFKFLNHLYVRKLQFQYSNIENFIKYLINAKSLDVDVSFLNYLTNKIIFQNAEKLSIYVNEAKPMQNIKACFPNLKKVMLNIEPGLDIPFYANKLGEIFSEIDYCEIIFCNNYKQNFLLDLSHFEELKFLKLQDKSYETKLSNVKWPLRVKFLEVSLNFDKCYFYNLDPTFTESLKVPVSDKRSFESFQLNPYGTYTYGDFINLKALTLNTIDCIGDITVIKSHKFSDDLSLKLVFSYRQWTELQNNHYLLCVLETLSRTVSISYEVDCHSHFKPLEVLIPNILLEKCGNVPDINLINVADNTIERLSVGNKPHSMVEINLKNFSKFKIRYLDLSECEYLQSIPILPLFTGSVLLAKGQNLSIHHLVRYNLHVNFEIFVKNQQTYEKRDFFHKFQIIDFKTNDSIAHLKNPYMLKESFAKYYRFAESFAFYEVNVQNVMFNKFSNQIKYIAFYNCYFGNDLDLSETNIEHIMIQSNNIQNIILPASLKYLEVKSSETIVYYNTLILNNSHINWREVTLVDIPTKDQNLSSIAIN